MSQDNTITKVCSLENCSSEIYNHAYLCNRHRIQLQRHGRIAPTYREHRPAIIDGSIAKIPLGLSREYTIVDREFSYLDKYKWSKDPLGYARSNLEGKSILLHRMVIKPPRGMSTDHINHDTLDNRRANLRTCTQGQNNMNSRKRRGATSIFKGVSWNTHARKWVAQVSINKKNIYLGCFVSETAAAKAYNKEAIKLFGDFAYTNSL